MVDRCDRFQTGSGVPHADPNVMAWLPIFFGVFHPRVILCLTNVVDEIRLLASRIIGTIESTRVLLDSFRGV